jgi:hypothetical protein
MNNTSDMGWMIKNVESLPEYFSAIETYILGRAPTLGRLPTVLYRGQSDSKWLPLAGLHRPDAFCLEGGNKSQFDLRQDTTAEKALVAELRDRCIPYANELFSIPERNDLMGWMTVAQHFLMRTRLLDFSGDPLIALRAATEKMGDNAQSKDRTGSSVFAIALPGLLPLNDIERQNPFGIEHGRWFRPQPIHRRFIAQKSHFFWQPTAETAVGPGLRINISLEAEKKIKPQLQRLGYGFGGMYPGIEGVAKDLDWKRKWHRVFGL